MRRLLAPLLLLPLLLGAAAQPGPSPTPGPGTLTVTGADSGRTVTLHPGDLLDVRLDALSDGAWRGVEGLESGTATLQLLSLRTGLQAPLTARLRALAPQAEPQALRAAGDHPCSYAPTPCARPDETWSLSVVVADGPVQSGDTACTQAARPTASAAPGSVTLDAGDDGRTVTVPQDGLLSVQLDGCAAPYARAPRGSRPLYRVLASVDRSRGTVDAVFRPQGTGGADVGAGYDAPCLHTTPSCALAQRAYAVQVEVGPPQQQPPAPSCAPVTLTGPGRAIAGDPVVLGGSTAPGSTVEVLFRRRGEQGFAVRRTLIAGDDGRFATTWRAVDDHRWYARTGTGCTSAPGLTQAVPVVTGPAVVRPGATVVLRVAAPSGTLTRVFLRGAGQAFTARRTLTGPGTVTYRATSDQRWYAATSVRAGPRRPHAGPLSSSPRAQAARHPAVLPAA